MTATDELERLTIEFHVDGRGNVFASCPAIDLAGSWSATPEAAAVSWCEAARRRFRELSESPHGSVRRDNLLTAYALLARLFS